ncbi:UNVERIFIED_CONTAM: hypothetical protein K2H54_034845 [Gekko kuhli]
MPGSSRPTSDRRGISTVADATSVIYPDLPPAAQPCKTEEEEEYPEAESGTARGSFEKQPGIIQCLGWIEIPVLIRWNVSPSEKNERKTSHLCGWPLMRYRNWWSFF